MTYNKIISGIGEDKINGKLLEANREGWVAKNISISFNGMRKEYAVLLEKVI